jgi:hypothetical protein
MRKICRSTFVFRSKKLLFRSAREPFINPTCVYQLSDQKPATMMYLEKNQWSRRFDSTFFSVTVDGTKLLTEPPQLPATLAGKRHHPAIYFELTVYCEHRTASILRRYSHFRWLFQRLDGANLNVGPLPRLPPGTCPFQKIEEDFLKNRKEELGEFLNELLTKPGVSQHPSVVTFLSLEEFANVREREGKTNPTVDAASGL